LDADLDETVASANVGKEERQRMQTWLEVCIPIEVELQGFHNLSLPNQDPKQTQLTLAGLLIDQNPW
jgi:hypothetical protein